MNTTWQKPELRPSGMNLLMEGKLRAPLPTPRSSFKSETVQNAWAASPESTLGAFYLMLLSMDQA